MPTTYALVPFTPASPGKSGGETRDAAHPADNGSSRGEVGRDRINGPRTADSEAGAGGGGTVGDT